jgi:Flp pilus assembly protein TadD
LSDTSNGGETELDSVLGEAARLVEEGEEQAALDMLLAAEPDYPSDATLLCMVGVVASHLGAEGMAVDYFRRCLAEEPTDPELLVRAGAGLAASGDPAAEPALRLAAITAPGFAPARMHYGAWLVRGGLFDQGLEELASARALDPADIEIRRETAIAYYLAGREEEARREAGAVVEMDSEDTEARLFLGLLLLLADEPARAAEELYPMAGALEEDSGVQLVLALTFALEGWMDEAWLALSRAESAPEPSASEEIREVEEALEDGDEAIRDLLLLELAPALLRARVHQG